jgi:hypothetical protein
MESRHEIAVSLGLGYIFSPGAVLFDRSAEQP